TRLPKCAKMKMDNSTSLCAKSCSRISYYRRFAACHAEAGRRRVRSVPLYPASLTERRLQISRRFPFDTRSENQFPIAHFDRTNVVTVPVISDIFVQSPGAIFPI